METSHTWTSSDRGEENLRVDSDSEAGSYIIRFILSNKDEWERTRQREKEGKRERKRGRDRESNSRSQLKIK